MVNTLKIDVKIDETSDKIEFELVIDSDDWIEIICSRVPSFKTFPDFTKYINSTEITLTNCTIPKN